MADIEYTVIVHEDEDGGYWTEVPALPGTGSQGETVEEAVENTRDAISLMVAHLVSRDAPIPQPRDVIVKVTVAA